MSLNPLPLLLLNFEVNFDDPASLLLLHPPLPLEDDADEESLNHPFSPYIAAVAPFSSTGGNDEMKSGGAAADEEDDDEDDEADDDEADDDADDCMTLVGEV
jgi:hypothetical protein